MVKSSFGDSKKSVRTRGSSSMIYREYIQETTNIHTKMNNVNKFMERWSIYTNISSSKSRVEKEL